MTSRRGIRRRSLLVGSGLAAFAACNGVDSEELARLREVEEDNVRLRATMAALTEQAPPDTPVPTPSETPSPTAVANVVPTPVPSPSPTPTAAATLTLTPTATSSPTPTTSPSREDPELIAGPFGNPVYAELPYSGSEYLDNRYFRMQSAYDFRRGWPWSSQVRVVRYSPASKLLATLVVSGLGGDSELALLNVFGDELGRAPYVSWRGAWSPIAWSHGGDRIAFASDHNDQVVSPADYVIIAGKSLDTLVRLDISGMGVADLSWSPDDRSVCGLLRELDTLTGSDPVQDTLHVRTWNAESGHIESDVEIRDDRNLYGAQVHWKRSGQILAVIKRNQDVRLDVAVFRLASPTDPAEYIYSIPGLGFDFFPPTRPLSFSPDEQFFAYVGPSVLGAAQAWVAKSDDGTLEGPTGFNMSGYPIAWSPFGERIATAGSYWADTIILVSDRREHELLQQPFYLPHFESDAVVNDLAWIDADTLAAGDNSGLLAIWKMEKTD